jgi:cobalt-zinc-cadmium resistance protein CzcA
MPLFSAARSAKSKSGRLQYEAEKARQEHTEQQLNNELRRLTAIDEKWSDQLRYYRETELPLADEQQRVAIASYKEGAIGYIDFIQNMKDAAKVQLDYWTAYGEYMTNRMNMIYF